MRTDTLPVTYRKTILFSCLFLLIVSFFFFAGDARADGLFDFQMKLAQKGNAEAQFKIGEMYEAGRGVKKDVTQARHWINKAAKQGHKTANYKLLYWHLESNKADSDSNAKLESLKGDARDGNGQAQYYIGLMLAEGVGLKKDSEKALNWLNKAALQGVLEAEFAAEGVREDAQRAALAKRRAAEKRKAAQQAKRAEQKRKQLEAKKRAEREKAAAARKAADQKRKQEEAARVDAEADKERQAALEKEREARREALLSQRKAREAKRKAEFESDPCSGKSARFLSTCR